MVDHINKKKNIKYKNKNKNNKKIQKEMIEKCTNKHFKRKITK